MDVKFYKPFFTGQELDYIKDILDQSLVISGDGKYTKRVTDLLEKTYHDSRVLLTTSGTTALELAIRLLNLPAGSNVICPSFTFSSTANAILMAGLNIQFVDVQPDTCNIDPTEIERHITPQTSAIMVMHYGGVACDMEQILKIATAHKLKVIEDAAQAIEGKYKNQRLGSIGDLGCFSFHETKNITCGEGGALLINQGQSSGQDTQALFSRAEILREKGTNRTEFFRGLVDKYTWVDIGSSYLPSDLLAAFLYAQFQHLEEIQTKRQTVFDFYYTALEPLERSGYLRRPIIPTYATPNAHLFYVFFKSGTQRNYVLNFLKKRGVSAYFHYIPLHSSPQGQRLGFKPQDCPVSEQVSQCLLRLPLYAGLKLEEAQYVVDTLSEAVKHLPG